MKQTAVEFLVAHLIEYGFDLSHHKIEIEQAKAMEKEQAHKYAEFAIRCDRKDMKILNFEDWIKL